MNDITPREDELLRLIQEMINNRIHKSEKRKWLQSRLYITSPSWLSGMKTSLTTKGYLEKDRNDFILTLKGLDRIKIYNSTSQPIFTPMYLPLIGEVRAGRTKQDELRVEMAEDINNNTQTISIPILNNKSHAFILKVKGTSMEHESIMEGDYVIVQPYPKGSGPKQRELIVALYLPPANESEATGDPDADTHLLEGPTIKYYTETGNKDRKYRLSWKRDISKSEFTIETKEIKPIGKVVGVYRTFIEP